MSSYYISIQNRLSRRIQAKKGAENLKPPALMNPGSEKAFADARKALKDEYLESLMMESHDQSVLIIALNQIGIDHKEIDINTYVTKAWESKRMDPELQEALDAQELANAEKRQKDQKSDSRQGQKIPGQQGIFDDKTKAVGGDVIRELMPRTIDALSDAIEQMRAEADIHGNVVEQFFRDADFDNTKSLEEQTAAYQSVWIAVRDLWIEHKNSSVNETPDSVNEEPPVVNEIGTFMNKEPLRLTGPVLGDEDIVEAEEVSEAEPVEVALDPAEDIDPAVAKLLELQMENCTRRDDLGISSDDLNQLYAEVAVPADASTEELLEQAEAVARRLDAMKPLKKRGEKKANKKKGAAAKQAAEESEAAEAAGLIG